MGWKYGSMGCPAVLHEPSIEAIQMQGHYNGKLFISWCQEIERDVKKVSYVALFIFADKSRTRQYLISPPIELIRPCLPLQKKTGERRAFAGWYHRVIATRLDSSTPWSCDELLEDTRRVAYEKKTGKNTRNVVGAGILNDSRKSRSELEAFCSGICLEMVRFTLEWRFYEYFLPCYFSKNWVEFLVGMRKVTTGTY